MGEPSFARFVHDSTLDQVGLGYISIDRSAPRSRAERLSASGRISGRAGSGRDLHPRRAQHRLTRDLNRLLGPSRRSETRQYRLVEHDSETMLRADHLARSAPEQSPRWTHHRSRPPDSSSRAAASPRSTSSASVKFPAGLSAALATDMPSLSVARAPTISRGSTSAFLWGRSPS